MNIRKEPVLLGLTAGVVALIAGRWFEEPFFPQKFNATVRAYETKAVPTTTLAGTVGKPAVRANYFTEPSETKSLPPRLLDFPPRASLTFAAVPLEIGPDYRHLYALRMDGGALAGVTIAQTGDTAAAAPEPVAEPEAPVAGQGTTRAQREAQAARTYDRIWIVGQSSPFFGTIEVDNLDLIELEAKKQFDGVVLRLRRYNVDTGKVGELQTFGAGQVERITDIALADTLRNQVRRQERLVPDTPGHLTERRKLIVWLLEQARENTTLYDDALRHALRYRELSPFDLEGLRLMQRVLRARGDFAGEVAMLEALPQDGAEAAFRFEGLGSAKARLGLWIEAEVDLRKATQLAPTDCRPHAALADFLRQRGQSKQALAVAQRAEQTLGSIQDAAELARVRTVITACLLAVGDVAGARACQQGIAEELRAPYLEGCLLYAGGDTAGALAAFQKAAGSIDSGAALVGQCACLVRTGQVQEAHDLALRAFDQEPLHRGRIATCLAAAFCRTGQFESALLWLDRALEAEPQDPYAFYLRGRVLRLANQSGPATEALAEALRQRDDFVHAIAEMAAVQTARAEAGGDAQVTAAVEARRYADRAVELAAKPSMELYEFQGLCAFTAADPSGASAAFAAARDLAPDERLKWYGKGAAAVVDYSRGLVDEPATALQRMVQDLGKDDPMAKWAQGTLDAIFDHAEKETLGDGFERSEPGTTWKGDQDGALGATIVQGQLVFDGAFSRTGPMEVKTERVGAVLRAKNFLAVGITMQQGSKHQKTNDFTGLGIEIVTGNGNTDLSVRVGIREQKPFLRIKDGSGKDKDAILQPPITVGDFVASARQQLELRVVPRGEPTSGQFALLVQWNGIVVHRHDLTLLTRNSTPELKTVLFASGDRLAAVDVVFDDYRLERRKDNR